MHMDTSTSLPHHPHPQIGVKACMAVCMSLSEAANVKSDPTDAPSTKEEEEEEHLSRSLCVQKGEEGPVRRQRGDREKKRKERKDH